MSSNPPGASVRLVTVALDRPLDLRKSRPTGSRNVVGLPGHVRLPGEPVVHLFAFGAAVIEAAALDATVTARITEISGAKILVETEETWSVDQATGTPEVGWDRVAMARLDERALATVALLLGQSAALERYDRQANGLVDDVLAIIAELREGGRLPWVTTGMVRRIAGIAGAQLELTRAFFLVDRPETTWEDPVAGGVFDVLYDHLELEERHAAVQEKLETLSSTLRTVSDLQHGRQSLLLEATIVLLIVVEVVMGLAHW